MINTRNVLIGLVIAALTAGIIIACGGGGGGSNNAPAPGCGVGGTGMVVCAASLDGTQAGTGAAGVGRGAVVVNSATRAITGGITFSGLTGNPTAAHIHRADTTIAVGLQLASDNATGVLLNNITLSDADYAELLAGTLYFNVHTPPPNGFPNGEIRGQINIQGGVTTGVSPLDCTQEVPPSTSPATGTGTVVVDSATREVLIAYVAHTVANANAGHIHTSVNTNPPCAGGPTCNGPVILGFPNLQTNVGGTGTNIAYPTVTSPRTTLTTANMTDFLANHLYFNIHSNVNNFCAPAANCGAGEIRGNIAYQ